MSSPILGQSGRPIVEFGSANAWLVRTKGDIVCSFQWMDIGDESGIPQAVMALYPVNRRMNGGAYVLPQEQAYRFADNKGRPTQHLMGAAFKYCSVTETFPDKSTIHRVMDIVLDGLGDLLKMPSDQPQTLAPVKQIRGIEAELKVNGQTIKEVLL